MVVSVQHANYAISAERATVPNLVLILTDDQGYGDISSHGNDKIRTPVMDRIAQEGARFDRFFVSPLCSPTRAALLTGRYHQRTGVSGVRGGAEIMRSDEVTIAQVLKSAGYATGCFGKWHNGENYPYHPLGKGFDEFFGFCGGHWDNYFNTTLEHNGKLEKTRGYITDDLTDAAIDFIRRHAQRPFFCYVPYNAPHTPVHVPDRYRERCAARGLDDKLAGIYAMVESVDENIGRLLATLDELKLRENTIVVFLTDNGPNGRRFNGGMAGIKGSSLEGGVRVPCFIRYPAKIRAGMTVKPIAAHIDLLPTLAELCGVREPKTLPLDGRNLVPLLTGADGAWPERTLFETGAARTQRWRLQTGGKKDRGLYDMQADPAQARDVSDQHPEVLRELSAAYEKWQAGVADGRKGMPPPVPVGHAEYPTAYLTAHLAQSSVHRTVPWTSAYFDAWKSGGEASWKIDVAAAGRFEVALVETCPAAAVGAKFRVSAGLATLEATVDKAHRPPPAPRMGDGARDQDWTVAVLGAIELPAGQATLTLRGLDVPGDEGLTIKAVRLTRLQ